MMRVRFNRHWNVYYAGDIAAFSAEQAAMLVRVGAAAYADVAQVVEHHAVASVEYCAVAPVVADAPVAAVADTVEPAPRRRSWKRG